MGRDIIRQTIMERIHGGLHPAEGWQRLREGLLFVGCLTSQQHASVSHGRICEDNFTCCHTEIELSEEAPYPCPSVHVDVFLGVACYHKQDDDVDEVDAVGQTWQRGPGTPGQQRVDETCKQDEGWECAMKTTLSLITFQLLWQSSCSCVLLCIYACM